ncbi:D-sedoheptulose-7-phosphate isomerase [Sphingomonas lycopersici]|uniref:Phosphoheptose isomerase n=1 Tax=Sphingomonas lycopersici TaxID=2951807 RepID=A0AA41ZDD0_9SPHN|nr:D-sedoheptulose 7-phosphate isomerase [Sphingomonas lycopersici]MCW6537267.1 D-sedoheptulose 7-phosphate isomerase [Sphingomonas lycopersici]
MSKTPFIYLRAKQGREAEASSHDNSLPAESHELWTALVIHLRWAPDLPMSLFLQNLDEHNALFGKLSALEEVIAQATAALTSALQQDNKIMFCGNGGSAADSQHLAAEFTGRFIQDRAPLAAIALSTDSSTLTCISNDYAFDQVFLRQVQALGKKGDCLVGISTSGNSNNVILAMEYARTSGITTIGLLGRDGGKLVELCDISIVVPSTTTARIQEAHILIGHTLCGAVEIALELVEK